MGTWQNKQVYGCREGITKGEDVCGCGWVGGVRRGKGEREVEIKDAEEKCKIKILAKKKVTERGNM